MTRREGLFLDGARWKIAAVERRDFGFAIEKFNKREDDSSKALRGKINCLVAWVCYFSISDKSRVYSSLLYLSTSDRFASCVNRV
ncbi:hypothetical protein V1477_019087, partial [Vespula maculifrons]